MKRIVLFLLIAGSCVAQSKQAFSLDECIATALKNNEAVKTGKLEIEQAKQMTKGYFDLPKTSVVFTQGQFNSVYKYDNTITATQTIPFPAVFSANRSLARSTVKESEYRKRATESDLVYQVKSTYYSLLYHYAIQDLLQKEDSIYRSFMTILNQKYAEGKSSILEKTTAETKVMEINSDLLDNTEEIVNFTVQLQTLMNTEEEVKIKDEGSEHHVLQLSADTSGIENNPYLLSLYQQIDMNEKSLKLERARVMPELSVGYFNLSIYGPANIGNGDYFLTTRNRLGGFIVGANIPLWFYSSKVKLDAIKLHTSIIRSNYDYNKTMFEGELKQNLILYAAYRRSIDFRKNGALANASQIITQAIAAFSKNEINYVDYLTIVSNALDTESHYLNVINKCNLAALRIQYLMTK
jgi:cobalt-zinc-cadmium resistance protein CzcA